MKQAILELGDLIRRWDEGEHSEHWTQDGNYMSCFDLDNMSEEELITLHHEMLRTLNTVIGEII